MFKFRLSVPPNVGYTEFILSVDSHHVSELQTKGGIEDNSKIIFLISQ